MWILRTSHTSTYLLHCKWSQHCNCHDSINTTRRLDERSCTVTLFGKQDDDQVSKVVPLLSLNLLLCARVSCSAAWGNDQLPSFISSQMFSCLGAKVAEVLRSIPSQKWICTSVVDLELDAQI